MFLSHLFLQVVKYPSCARVVGKQMGVVVHFALHFSLIQKCSSSPVGAPIHLLLNVVLKVKLVLSRQVH